MNLTREELEEMLKIAKYASRGFKFDKDILSHHETYIHLLESVLGLSDALNKFTKEDQEDYDVDEAYYNLLKAKEKYCFK